MYYLENSLMIYKTVVIFRGPTHYFLMILALLQMWALGVHWYGGLRMGCIINWWLCELKNQAAAEKDRWWQAIQVFPLHVTLHFNWILWAFVWTFALGLHCVLAVLFWDSPDFWLLLLYFVALAVLLSAAVLSVLKTCIEFGQQSSAGCVPKNKNNGEIKNVIKYLI